MYIVIYKAFYLDVAQGRMNRAPIENRNHWWNFASLACKSLFRQQHQIFKNVYSNLQSFYLDVAQGRMNRAPIENRNHWWKFASLASKPLYQPQRQICLIYIVIYKVFT